MTLKALLPSCCSQCPTFNNLFFADAIPNGVIGIVCPECKHVFCRLCREAPHKSKTCEEAEAEKENLNAFAGASEAMTAAVVRKCPKCRKPFFKEEGCNKMTAVTSAGSSSRTIVTFVRLPFAHIRLVENASYSQIPRKMTGVRGERRHWWNRRRQLGLQQLSSVAYSLRLRRRSRRNKARLVVHLGQCNKTMNAGRFRTLRALLYALYLRTSRQPASLFHSRISTCTSNSSSSTKSANHVSKRPDCRI